MTASDGTDTSSAGVSDTVTIENTAPTPPTIAIFPDEPEYGVDDVRCQVTVDSGDTDGDEVSYEFTWTRDGVAFTGASTTLYDDDTVSASVTSEGETYTCSVVATDGTDDAATRTDSVTILAPSYTIGYDSEYSYTGTENPDIIHAIPVTVSSDVELYKLAKITKEDNGNTFKMALYRDSGGAPGARVAYTASSDDAVGSVEVEVNSAPVSVSAGDYSFAWRCGSAACRTGFNNSGSSSDEYCTRTGFSYGSAWPSSFGTATCTTGLAWNVYMRVRD